MPANQGPLNIPEEIERGLVGESKQTALMLFSACNLLMWIDEKSKHISNIITLFFIAILVARDVGFFPAFVAILACSWFTHIIARNHLIVTRKDDVNMAIEMIREVMEERGSSSVANWLTIKDRKIGRIIQEVISR